MVETKRAAMRVTGSHDSGSATRRSSQAERFEYITSCVESQITKGGIVMKNNESLVKGGCGRSDKAVCDSAKNIAYCMAIMLSTLMVAAIASLF